MFVWTGKIVADALHVSANRANIALVALSAALGVGRIVAVPLLRWIGNTGMIWLSTAIVLIGSIVMRNANQLSGMIAASIIIGLGLSAIFPTALGMAGDRFPQETGTVFGAIIAIALLGGTGGPKVAGWLASHGIRQVLFVPIIGALGVAALTAVVAKQQGRAAVNATTEL
jgi:fucose permease